LLRKAKNAGNRGEEFTIEVVTRCVPSSIEAKNKVPIYELKSGNHPSSCIVDERRWSSEHMPVAVAIHPKVFSPGSHLFLRGGTHSLIEEEYLNEGDVGRAEAHSIRELRHVFFNRFKPGLRNHPAESAVAIPASKGLAAGAGDGRWLDE